MLLTFNNNQARRCQITWPSNGAVEVSAEVNKSSSTTITVGEVMTVVCGSYTFPVKITNVSDFSERLRISGVVGKDDLRDTVEAKELLSITLLDVINSLGLSSTIIVDSTIASIQKSRFIVTKQSKIEAIRNICSTWNVRWTMTSSGELKISPLTTFNSLLESSDIVILQDIQKTLQLGLKTPLSVLGGDSIGDKKIKSIIYSWSDKDIKASAMYGDIESEDDLFNKKVRKATAHTDYYYPHSAIVLGQNSDGTVDIRPQDESIPSMTSVTLMTSSPGYKFLGIEEGSLCWVMFQDGDPTQPFVTFFPRDNTVSELVVTGGNSTLSLNNSSATLNGSSILLGTGADKPLGDVSGLITAINSLIQSLNTNIIAYNACIPIPASPLGGSAPMTPLVPLIAATYVSTVAKVKL